MGTSRARLGLCAANVGRPFRRRETRAADAGAWGAGDAPAGRCLLLLRSCRPRMPQSRGAGPGIRQAGQIPPDTVDDVLSRLTGTLLLAAVLSGSALTVLSPQTASASASAPALARSVRAAASANGVPASPHAVVLIGIPGLRWSDISASATPSLWRLAERGSGGSLVVTAVPTRPCPVGTCTALTGPARATAPRPKSPPSPPLPAVAPAAAGAPGAGT